MIISHRHKFIFIKTLKTAGTSIEVALAKICGPEDVITDVAPQVPDHAGRNAAGFYNHMPAKSVKERLGDDIWDSYFKFAFERNPWDKEVSWYWFLKKKRGYHDTFRDFCVKGFLSGPDDFPETYGRLMKFQAWLWWSRHNPYSDLGMMELLFRRYMSREDFQGYPMDYDRYSIDGKIAMDFMGRFECLEQDLEAVARRIGITNEIILGKEKSSSRKDDSLRYQHYFDETTKDLVARRFEREIRQFGYRF